MLKLKEDEDALEVSDTLVRQYTYYTNILKLLLQIHENTVDLKFDQTKVILKIKTTTKIKNLVEK